MRSGDFGVEILPVRGDDVREIDSGHVLAKSGAVYSVRLRNFGPLRCVTDVRIDGKPVTAGGLVLEPYGLATLERPIDDVERGRFTVVAEGDERVFGPDGGRDNPDLGLIDARFRRELPSARGPAGLRALPDVPSIPYPAPRPSYGGPLVPPAPGRPMAPPQWTPSDLMLGASRGPDISAIASSMTPPAHPVAREPAAFIERAAGTGLTGHSSQEFVPAFVGPLEAEATVLQLRLVIGADEAFSAPRPLPSVSDAPARPAARP